MTIRCRKCGYEAENPEEFHRGCCWACVMGPWDEELDTPGEGGIAVAACDHDRSFVRWSTREIVCYWCGELLGRK